jgi:hypothetical protein
MPYAKHALFVAGGTALRVTITTGTGLGMPNVEWRLSQRASKADGTSYFSPLGFSSSTPIAERVTSVGMTPVSV